jgi:hypothetical protein
MPPVLVWILGAVGVVAAAKLFSVVSKKANADLDRVRREGVADRDDMRKLERDPLTGTYRPRKS